MNNITTITIIATFLSVAIFYLSEIKRFKLVFAQSLYPEKFYLPIKIIAWMILLAASYLWTLPNYGWEVGITRWLVGLATFGFIIIFLAPAKPKIFQITLALAALIGVGLLVF